MYANKKIVMFFQLSSKSSKTLFEHPNLHKIVNKNKQNKFVTC